MKSLPTVTLLPGDLIGRDLAGPITELCAAAGAEVEWEWIEDVTGDETPVTAACLASIRKNKVALKAPFATPAAAGRMSPSVALRKALDLYAGIRHVRSLRGLRSRYPALDLVVIRENTEDVYAGLEHEVHPGVVESIKVVTRAASKRIFELAYRYARDNGRKKVAIIHKANIMKQSDGLFLRVGEEVAAQNPDIETRGLIVDNTCMQLVQRPEQFDVLVCGNLYGDIISDLGAGLVGGISAVWGLDRGDDIFVYEAIHGRVPQLIGRDAANPLPMLMPAIHLLRHIGQSAPADRLAHAVEAVLVEGRTLTADLGGTAKTSEMLVALKNALGE
ncbi:MAG: isocitrate/isopropylmalate family dehydrogenase [bacterium]|nr:NAD-dependent isocitrate dehydrogenase [Myxococcales bacterium]MCB9543530.1 NAD-dependent isocitrate dehydrogenase [Myxococcales bacterium]